MESIVILFFLVLLVYSFHKNKRNNEIKKQQEERERLLRQIERKERERQEERELERKKEQKERQLRRMEEQEEQEEQEKRLKNQQEEIQILQIQNLKKQLKTQSNEDHQELKSLKNRLTFYGWDIEEHKLSALIRIFNKYNLTPFIGFDKHGRLLFELKESSLNFSFVQIKFLGDEKGWCLYAPYTEEIQEIITLEQAVNLILTSLTENDYDLDLAEWYLTEHLNYKIETSEAGTLSIINSETKIGSIRFLSDESTLVEHTDSNGNVTLHISALNIIHLYK